MKQDTKSKTVLFLSIFAVFGLLCCGMAACLIINLPAITEWVSPPPGKGTKAELGFKECAPVIKALNAYYKAEGKYPATLDALIPAYAAEVPVELNGLPLGYETTQTSYRLEFRYTGPGMNICAYTPEDNWKCSGYY